MKPTGALILSVFLACSASAAENEAVQKEITELVLKFNEEYKNNNLDAYFSYYADDVTQWWPEGRVSLADYKKQWYELIANGGGVEKNVISDLQVQVGPSGDSAVATYRLDVITRQPNGERTEETALETDVWFKRNGKWQVAHLHYNSKPVED
ncbi:MAG: nuclear transport factor 2 family protein [Vicinamibacteria bacterium]